MSARRHSALAALAVLVGAGVAAGRAEAPAVVKPPAPVGALPSARQLAWHEQPYYGFVHFTVNTFTDREWGTGDETPDVFAPSAFDARQWARAAREAGMAGLILTAKHHDGFCLWPSRYTDHSVRSSRWQDGRGDVVGALAEACRAEGLKLGLYLSPWDRHHAAYGRPGYLDYYRAQLRELLTQYGPLFEVWFDGANGGDGYYGGAREARRIDAASYYEWAQTWGLVRELQPQAVIFSDAGPDVRWVGNEKGVGFETTWMGLDRRGAHPGMADYAPRAPGSPDAADWVPPEVDVSIRPGWFYHAAEDARVKSVAALVEIYYSSVGRSGSLLLNVPPDRRGLFHETDVARLAGLRRWLDATFASDLARGASARSAGVRGGAPEFAAARAVDGDPATYWATDDGVDAGGARAAPRGAGALRPGAAARGGRARPAGRGLGARRGRRRPLAHRGRGHDDRRTPDRPLRSGPGLARAAARRALARLPGDRGARAVPLGARARGYFFFGAAAVAGGAAPRRSSAIRRRLRASFSAIGRIAVEYWTTNGSCFAPKTSAAFSTLPPFAAGATESIRTRSPGFSSLRAGRNSCLRASSAVRSSCAHCWPAAPACGPTSKAKLITLKAGPGGCAAGGPAAACGSTGARARATAKASAFSSIFESPAMQRSHVSTNGSPAGCRFRRRAGPPAGRRRPRAPAARRARGTGERSRAPWPRTAGRSRRSRSRSPGTRRCGSGCA